MTYPEKCHWLWRYQAALHKEKLLQDELAARRKQAQGRALAMDGMPHGTSDGQSLPRMVESIVKAEQELECQRNICKALRCEIVELINSVPDEHDREILRRRYMVGQTFEHISDDMLLEYRWVRRRHKRCVNRLEF